MIDKSLEQVEILISAIEAVGLSVEKILRRGQVHGFVLDNQPPQGYRYDELLTSRARELRDAKNLGDFITRMEHLLGTSYNAVLNRNLYIVAYR